MRRRVASSLAWLAALALGCADPVSSAEVATRPGAPSVASSAHTATAPAPGSSSADAPDPPPPPPPTPPVRLAMGGAEAVRGEHGVVTTVEANATRAAAQVLERGGNAVDAAVAAAYVLAVTHPSAGNLGGGGFMLVRLASGQTAAIDFREIGAASITTAKVIAEVEAGGAGWASTAVPGTVAGLGLAAARFGTRPVSELVEPAVRLAKNGHRLSPRAAQSLRGQWSKLKLDREARLIFGKDGGKEPKEAGDRIRQPDLAKTLAKIGKEGDAGFYQGSVAEAVDAAMKANGGDVTKADLAAYRPKVREPLRITYRGFTVETMPPPSMGGVAIAETLSLLERLDAHAAPADSARAYHLFLEAAKRAYADRRSVGVDPDFLTDDAPWPTVADVLRGRHLLSRPVSLERATPAAELSPELAGGPKESPETTHLSVVDAEGNAVSCTVTLSASFGAKVVVPGTGVLLSNAAGAFSPKGPNEAAPHKRMASSMSPTIVSRDGRAMIVVGSPGGDTIPNVVTQVLVNLIDRGMTVDAAVKRGRVHHQLSPDSIRVEIGNEPPAEVKKGLLALGHQIVPSPLPLGDVKVIVVDEATGAAYAFADRREGGLALAAAKKNK